MTTEKSRVSAPVEPVSTWIQALYEAGRSAPQILMQLRQEVPLDAVDLPRHPKDIYAVLRSRGVTIRSMSAALRLRHRPLPPAIPFLPALTRAPVARKNERILAALCQLLEERQEILAAIDALEVYLQEDDDAR